MNNTLSNGFKVLEYLAADAEECSVKDLADHFNLPKSHVCRLLKTLTETGYVEQPPGSRKYRISLKILNLSHTRLRKLQLRNQARPYMHKLAQELNRPVFVTANYHGYSLIVDTEYPENYAGDAGLVIGQIHLVNRSACGKICAAYASPECLEELLEDCDWSQKTSKSITSPELFKEELSVIRQTGIARMDSETSHGVGAVGVPLFNAKHELVGALGVIMPVKENWTEEEWEFFSEKTKSCGQSISFALGCPLDSIN